jgi:hypothetical protein
MIKNLMNLSIFTVFIVNACFIVSTWQLDNEEEVQKTCLNARAAQIKSSLHRKAIICEIDEPCVLESNHCLSDPNPIWLKQFENKSSQAIDFDDEDEHFFISKFSKDLIITSSRSTDEGFYWQTIYNKTVVAEFHITVLTSEQLVRRPIDHNMGTKTDLNLGDHEQTIRIDPTGIEIRTEWQEWSECFCTHGLNHSKSNSRGYRLRLGDCHLKLASRAKSTNANSKTTFLRDVEKLLERFKSVPCLSQLIPAKFKEIFATKFFHYVMYASCEPSASCQMDSNRNRSKSMDEKTSTDEKYEEQVKRAQYKDLVEPAQSQLIMSQANQEIVLGCELKRNLYDFYSNDEDMVNWYFVDEKKFLNFEQNISDLDSWLIGNIHINGKSGQDTSEKADRLFVNADFSLHIKKATKSDSGIYSCHLNNLTRLIYVLRVSQQVPYNIIIYLTYFGIYFLLFTLISINCRIMIDAVNNRSKMILVSSRHL